MNVPVPQQLSILSRTVTVTVGNDHQHCTTTPGKENQACRGRKQGWLVMQLNKKLFSRVQIPSAWTLHHLCQTIITGGRAYYTSSPRCSATTQPTQLATHLKHECASERELQINTDVRSERERGQHTARYNNMSKVTLIRVTPIMISFSDSK